MREIVVIQKSGTLRLNNRKPLRTVVKAEHKQSLLSQDVVNVSVESKTPLSFNLNDKIEYAGRYFILNTAPKVRKQQGFYFYDLVFEGSQYSLRKKIYFNLDKTGFQTSSEFPLTGEINMFLKVLINNINQIDDFTWELGEYPQNTEAKTLTFSNDNCLAVLQKICQEYDTEFEIKDNITARKRILNIKKIGKPIDYSFEYGKGLGLYTLSRDNEVEDVITRLYIYGSSDNLPNNYRNFSEKLRMPTSQGDFIESAEKVKLFGLKEGVKILDDIKPSFKGVITSVGRFDENTKSQEIVVSNMDFDLNERDSNGTKYLIDGTPAKLHFNKGNLAGYSFELIKGRGYDHATKTFRVKQFTDERGQKFPDPNTILSFKASDEFTILDIAMPERYITNAENRLLEEGRKEYDKIAQNNVKYTLDIDPMFLKKKGNTDTIFFEVGDYVHLVDTALNIDKRSRIINLTRDLLNPYDYKIDIADTYEITLTESVLNDIKDTKTIVSTQAQINRQNYLAGVRNMEELRSSVFDTDGYFDTEKIKPNSVETNMLSVGARSQNFVLENVTLTPNVNGNAGSVNISNGKLVHFSLENNIREWAMLGVSKQGLLDIVYYVYAKVEKNGNNGSWLITTEKIKFDERPNYYHFLCYLLYTPKNGKREAEAMYGNVTMHGGQITAGRIKSANGKSYFDLDNGEILGKISFTDDSPELSQMKKKTDNFDNRTDIKGGLVSTNVVEVGNNDQNKRAFISGITDEGDMSIRFGAGASYENKNNAPFRVLDNGKMIASDAEITGTINANRGRIGGFDIANETLRAGEAWKPKSYFSNYSTQMFIMREIGATTEQVREFSYGQTSALSTGRRGATVVIKNTLNEDFHFNSSSLSPNIALQLEAKNGSEDIALDIKSGGIRIEGKKGYTGEVLFWEQTEEGWGVSSYIITRKYFEITNGIITNVKTVTI